MTEDRPSAAVRERVRTGDDERSTGDRRHGGRSASPSRPVETRSVAELAAVVDGNRVALADFYADWCSPCQTIEPVVEAIAAETDAAVATVDVDVNQPAAAEYDVRALPTLVLFVEGDPVDRFAGAVDETGLIDAVERRL